MITSEIYTYKEMYEEDDDSIGANYSQVGDVAKIATTKQLRNNN